MADCFAELMTGVLGFERFAAQGGDWGAFVTSRLGAVHADKLIGIHLNLLALRRDPLRLSNRRPKSRSIVKSWNSGSRRRWVASGSRARGRRRWHSA